MHWDTVSTLCFYPVIMCRTSVKTQAPTTTAAIAVRAVSTTDILLTMTLDCFHQHRNLPFSFFAADPESPYRFPRCRNSEAFLHTGFHDCFLSQVRHVISLLTVFSATAIAVL